MLPRDWMHVAVPHAYRDGMHDHDTLGYLGTNLQVQIQLADLRLFTNSTYRKVLGHLHNFAE